HARLRGRQPRGVVRGQLPGLRGRPQEAARRGGRAAASPPLQAPHARLISGSRRHKGNEAVATRRHGNVLLSSAGSLSEQSTVRQVKPTRRFRTTSAERLFSGRGGGRAPAA